jgi:hypothetical protein
MKPIFRPCSVAEMASFGREPVNTKIISTPIGESNSGNWIMWIFIVAGGVGILIGGYFLLTNSNNKAVISEAEQN